MPLEPRAPHTPPMLLEPHPPTPAPPRPWSHASPRPWSHVPPRPWSHVPPMPLEPRPPVSLHVAAGRPLSALLQARRPVLKCSPRSRLPGLCALKGFLHLPHFSVSLIATNVIMVTYVCMYWLPNAMSLLVTQKCVLSPSCRAEIQDKRPGATVKVSVGRATFLWGF